MPGIVSVLHTSGSDLKYHPHVHMIVSGGGKVMGKEGEYKELAGDWLGHQRVLGRQVKELYEKLLLREYHGGRLAVFRSISNEEDLKKWLRKKSKDYWVVNIEPPMRDVNEVIGYVGRYTKKACISDYRLEEIGDQIKFRYKDYKNSVRGEKPLESLKVYSPVEFLDELLQHVPKKRYRTVRYYGLYNSRYMKHIPKDLRLSIEEVSPILVAYEEGYDWGEYEQYRKSLLESGQDDPLWCYICNQEKVLLYVKYYEDSS